MFVKLLIDTWWSVKLFMFKYSCKWWIHGWCSYL